jgi:excisionase family DNA binding protein
MNLGTPPSPPPFSTISDVAKRLQVSTKTVRRWIKNGELIGHLIGSQWRISENDFELFLRTRRGANQADIGVQ